MWENFKANVADFRTWVLSWFKDSETIFLSRLWVLFGIVISGMASVDFTLIANSDHQFSLGAWLIFQGILQEVARRYRATDL